MFELVATVIMIIVMVVISKSNEPKLKNPYKNDPNKVWDFQRQYWDDIHVTTGELSKEEFNRRLRSGYYFVDKGTEYNRDEEQRQKRIKRWKDEGIMK